MFAIRISTKPLRAAQCALALVCVLAMARAEALPEETPPLELPVEAVLELPEPDRAPEETTHAIPEVVPEFRATVPIDILPDARIFTVTFMTLDREALWWYDATENSRLKCPDVERFIREGDVFLHWVEMDGHTVSEGEPVARSLVLYPVTVQRAVEADLSSWVRLSSRAASIDAAYAVRLLRDGDPESAFTRTLDTTILHHDPDAGAYYLDPQDLPAYVQADLFHNRAPLHADASAWQWGAGHSLFADGSRWYLDDPEQALATCEEPVCITYRAPIALYSVRLYDSNGTPLGEADVLAGGSVAGLAYDQNFLSLLPAQQRDLFTGWTADIDTHPGFPYMIDAPLRVHASYRQTFPVSFYLSLYDATPLCQWSIPAGASIDWADAPTPTLEDRRFMGWQLYDGYTGQLGQEINPDTQVDAPTAFIAAWVNLFSVAFVDAQGGHIAFVRCEEGAPIGDAELSAIHAPERPGLAFSHWEDASGVMLTQDYTFWANDETFRPVYTARVSFWHGETLIAEKTIREGDYLWDFPEPPALEGQLFLGWDKLSDGGPVLTSTHVYALYENLCSDSAQPDSTPAPVIIDETPPMQAGEAPPADTGHAPLRHARPPVPTEPPADMSISGCHYASMELFE